MAKNSLEYEIKQDNRKRKTFFNANNSLANFIIPFIMEVNSLGKLNDLYFKYLIFKHNCPLNVINSNISSLINDSPEMKELSDEMKILYFKMVSVAFSESELNEEDSRELENRIRLATPEINWKAQGKTGKKQIENPETIKVKDPETGKEYNLEKFDLEIAKHLRGIITSELIEAFDNSNGKEPIGYKFFGKCPECGRFFIKTSKNKAFCSDSCSAIKRGREYRKRLLVNRIIIR
jgi:hypothetical protein